MTIHFDFDRDWKLYVDGAFRASGDGGTRKVENPATGESFATAPDGTAQDVDEAVAAASRTADTWSWTDPDERADYLYQIAERIEQHYDELVGLETMENGKPLDQSENDVTAAVATFRYYAGGADKLYADTIEHSPEEIRKTVYEPYGVVGIIIPWNWPPMHTADFVAPALATGNTVVLKPAPDTPLSSLLIAELAHDVLPAGTLNVVTGGVDPGVALTSHEDVDMLAFTGHDETGEKVLKAAAEHITPTMMELGGKNPAIVFGDADLEKTVPGVVATAFYNSGQACSDAERILVQEDVYEEFTSRLSSEVDSLIVGDGTDEETQIGPLANESQVAKFHRYLDIAQSEGADILAQADTPDDPDLAGGHWVSPTLLDGVEPDSRFAQEEVFGPIAGVITFADEQEAVEIANDVDYGLTATIWSQDVSRANRVAAHLDAGGVAINATGGGGLGLPFGGYKRSGIGRKKDFSEATREFVQAKSIRVDLTDEPPSL